MCRGEEPAFSRPPPQIGRLNRRCYEAHRRIDSQPNGSFPRVNINASEGTPSQKAADNNPEVVTRAASLTGHALPLFSATNSCEGADIITTTNAQQQRTHVPTGEPRKAGRCGHPLGHLCETFSPRLTGVCSSLPDAWPLDWHMSSRVADWRRPAEVGLDVWGRQTQFPALTVPGDASATG